MMKGSVIGQDVLAKNIALFTKGFIRQVNLDMQSSEKILKTKVKENISNTDFSLKDLARMGHPYSRTAPATIHIPNYIVHKQSGNMLRGLYSKTNPASVSRTGKLNSEAFVGIAEEIEYAQYVIYGTSKMVPRNFLQGSLNEVENTIIKTLSRSLRNATISFNGKKVKL